MRKLSANENKKLRTVIGSNIAKYRKKAGMTQESFAAELDTDRVTVAYAEIGKRTPKVSTLYQMAEVLGVDIQDLFKGLGSHR